MNPKAKMKLIELKDKLSAYKGGYTAQNWRKDNDFSYENDYIKVLRLDSSNVSGGSSVHNGKQWSIIVDIKKLSQIWKIGSSYALHIRTNYQSQKLIEAF